MKRLLTFHLLVLAMSVFILVPSLTIACSDNVLNSQDETLWVQKDVSRSTLQQKCDSPQKQDDPYVYITKNGEKYHRYSCGYLKKSKIKIRLSGAKRRGLVACTRCNPPK